jgi:hypothetical protein
MHLSFPIPKVDALHWLHHRIDPAQGAVAVAGSWLVVDRWAMAMATAVRAH